MGQGLIHIYTGDGKGKTTAATGLAVRAAGFGLKVLFVQFFKEDEAPSGEKSFFTDLARDTVTVLRSNCRHPFFTGDKTDEGAVNEAIRRTFDKVRESVEEGGPDLLVLDEIMAVLRGGWIPLPEFIDFIESRPAGLEVALTGRDAPSELVAISDYVTEMLKIKHPFDEGVKARKGFDY
ncbi:MAG: cob(I)yrinic acid a,c-diamide adenosyltransferase [Thermodesulfobacteriota bacterium]